MLMTTMSRLGDLLANMNKFTEALVEYEQGIQVLGLSPEALAVDRAVAEVRFMIGKVILYENGPAREDRALAHLYPATNAVIHHLS